MTWIKICGMTREEDALEAVSLEVQALGFIFAPSPRRISPAKAREIISRLPASILKVGVFVDEEMTLVNRIAQYCGLGMLQFHGRESPDYCRQARLPVIKAIAVKDLESLRRIRDYPFTTILLDAWSSSRAGGLGKTFPWELALRVREESDFLLSGGLNPQNVREAIQWLHPAGVDVCSGVEKALGQKDAVKMREFVAEVRKADLPT